MLKLKAVKKFYDKHLVLEISYLELEKGIYWVKGSNGSGKTTLLKLIAGILPFEGDISYNEKSLKAMPLIYRRNVSWAEAEPMFPLFMSGMDLLLLYQRIRNVSKHDIDYLIDIFNMKEFVKSTIVTYSAGMTKKLSLVLAFLGNQQLIVLDEPLITLDSDSFAAVCTFILDKYKNSETTFLMSSHQQLDSYLILSGKVLLINNKNGFLIE